MAIQPSVRYINTGSAMVAKPVSIRLSGSWYAVQALPGMPTAVTATAGDGSATISWTAPTDTGGIPLTGFTLTSTPGGVTATTTNTMTTMSSLTNGTSYTFTVVATNAIGNSAASTSSNSITPQPAVTGAMYISPANGNYAVGATFTLAVRENSFTTPANSVQANLTYNQAILRFNAADTSTSPFTTSLQNTGGGGSIQIGLGSLSGSVTGDQIVANISFTVLSAASTTVAVATSSAIYRASDSVNILNSYTGGNYTTA